MELMNRIVLSAPCPTCRGLGAITRHGHNTIHAPHHVFDACAKCAAMAEAEYQALTEAERRHAIAVEVLALPQSAEAGALPVTKKSKLCPVRREMSSKAPRSRSAVEKVPASRRR